jgi:hypothetical protein
LDVRVVDIARLRLLAVSVRAAYTMKGFEEAWVA